jgi:hypothetical protein
MHVPPVPHARVPGNKPPHEFFTGVGGCTLLVLLLLVLMLLVFAPPSTTMHTES